MFLLHCFCDGSSSSNNDKDLFTMLDNEYESLTPEGKQRVHDEIYGVEKVIDETDIFIEKKIVELGNEISLLSDEIKKPYMQAIEMEKEEERIAWEKASIGINQSDNMDSGATTASQKDVLTATEENHGNNSANDAKYDENQNQEPPYTYVRSVEFRLMFLRADKFDARLAARRITRFFQMKLSLFGESKLCHRIKIKDLDDKDLNALYGGGLCTTGVTDGSGRLIFINRRKRHLKHSILNSARAIFYLVVSQVEKSIDSQKKGIVVIAQNRNFNGYEIDHNEKPWLHVRKLFPLCRMTFRVLPVRATACHVLYDNIFDNVATKLIVSLFPKSLIPAVIPHYCLDDDECKEIMMDYGIDVDILPLAKGGDFDTERIQQYLEEESKK